MKQFEDLSQRLLDSASCPSLEALRGYLASAGEPEEVNGDSVYKFDHNHRIVLRGDGEISAYNQVEGLENAPVEEVEGKESLHAVCNTYRTAEAFKDQAEKHGFKVEKESQVGDLMISSLKKV